ncbi:WG repeat-containing protein [Psychrobacter aestuarii]|uniref:WG repeat-containing protein n=1 Tax=Psychrobacter aestuarii TaxID=556327 RepID=A0ABP3FMZ1_9GAMM|nr:WG repeat-containing protein [Psychrobacter aestuarii]
MFRLVRSFTTSTWGTSAAIFSVCVAGMLAGTSAQAASCKLPKSYYKNVSCIPNSALFLAIKDYGEPVALINKSGKPVVNLSAYQTVAVDKVASGVMPVLKNGRVGYINLQGREVIAPMYDQLGGNQWARAAADGRIIVKKGGQYGVIDTNNRTIVPFSSSITNISDYRGGVARIESRQGNRQVDVNGKEIAPPSTKAKPAPKNPASERAAAVAEPMEAKAAPPRHAPFTTLNPHQQDGLWGFVDDDGMIMITYSFDEVRPFSEGLAAVRIENTWGFLNLGGDVVIPFDYENDMRLSQAQTDAPPAWVFKNGVAWVGMSQQGERMCINKANVSLPCPS